jgi:hypothetical protein
VDDIISQGEDPGSRGPWPRRLTIGAIVVVVLALLIVQHLPRSGQHRPRHAPRSAGSASAATGPGRAASRRSG